MHRSSFIDHTPYSWQLTSEETQPHFHDSSNFYTPVHIKYINMMQYLSPSTLPYYLPSYHSPCTTLYSMGGVNSYKHCKLNDHSTHYQTCSLSDEAHVLHVDWSITRVGIPIHNKIVLKTYCRRQLLTYIRCFFGLMDDRWQYRFLVTDCFTEIMMYNLV